jgi:cytidylate kinase
MIIAIDGTNSSGKGTLARRLAAHFGLPHLDTGLLYRAVAVAAGRSGLSLQDETGCAALAAAIDLRAFDEADLRTPEAGHGASIVAAQAGVRRELLDLQRRFAQQPGGAVLDGRDIGTVIAPGAEVKLWVDADVEERARRRFLDFSASGEKVDLPDVLARLRERDERDAGRRDAPMKPADDAIWIDTTRLSPEACLAKAIDIVEARTGKRR